jgi:hypothetical protein
MGMTMMMMGRREKYLRSGKGRIVFAVKEKSHINCVIGRVSLRILEML